MFVHKDKNIQELSRGMAQIIQVLGTILHDPDLVVLDEPFSGLDPVNVRAICEVIDELGIEGRTIGLSSVSCSGPWAMSFNFDGALCPHGRSPAMGTALKRIHPNTIVFTAQGDGDLGSIGLGCFVNALLRGEKLTTFFLNNASYGMTGGQMAPTTLIGMRTSTTPEGRDATKTGYPFFELKDKKPRIHPEVAYISPSAIIIGDVTIGKGCSIFDNVIIEGDVAPVVIGDRVNIQSQSVIHTIPDGNTMIVSNVTIGHRAVVHGAKIEENVTIGIGSLVASYASVGKGAIIGEGAVVTQKSEIPPRILAVGVPAKVVKSITNEQEEYAVEVARLYCMEGKERAEFLREVPVKSALI